MRKATIAIAILGAGLTAACAPAGEHAPAQGRHAARIAAATPSGPPIDCVDTNRIRSTRVLDDQTIDFEMIDSQTYRNILPHSCPGLGSREAFSYKTSINRLCSVDFITVLYQDGGGPRPGASCGLGAFQPVSFPR